jgi:chromosome condensin MukBEF complex kleisin-like MukF subunit
MPIDNIPDLYQNKYLIFHYSAIEYLDLIKKQQKVVTDKKDLLSLQEIADKLKKDDNDVLMICKMRL